jgi:hypothetical protein
MTAIESRDVSEWIDALEKLVVIADHLLDVGGEVEMAGHHRRKARVTRVVRPRKCKQVARGITRISRYVCPRGPSRLAFQLQSVGTFRWQLSNVKRLPGSIAHRQDVNPPGQRLVGFVGGRSCGPRLKTTLSSSLISP